MLNSLLELCIYELIKRLAQLQETRSLLLLPQTAKLVFVDKLSKRGILTENSFNQLVTARLESLDLSDCNINCDSIIDSLCRCNGMQTFCIDSRNTRPSVTLPSAYFTTISFCHLLSFWSHLTDLRLKACYFVDDSVLLAISVYCPLIEILYLDQCSQISDTGVASLCNLSCIFSLNLSAIHGITSSALTSIGNSNFRFCLTEIGLAKCQKLDDDGINALVNGCPNLKIISTHGCKNLTNRWREYIRMRPVIGSKTHSGLSGVTWTINLPYVPYPNPQI